MGPQKEDDWGTIDKSRKRGRDGRALDISGLDPQLAVLTNLDIHSS